MIQVAPVTLTRNGVRLEPLSQAHADGLRAAAQDGELWKLRITSVPEPQDIEAYIAKALDMHDRVPFAVIDIESSKVLGTTSYHDILPVVDRLEIGWTWYAKSVQRTHVNTSCKLMLLEHAFESLGCAVVGWRTDTFNVATQAAIERLGAKKDGVIRHHAPRRDGTVRDTVMYSMLRGEWPEVRAHLEYRLARHLHPT
jgi:RimJ/RimL family protein N-acetyltransferase